MGLAYLILDDFAYQCTLLGVYDSLSEAEKLRDKFINDFRFSGTGGTLFTYAEKKLLAGNTRYELNVERFKKQNRTPPKRWDWIDLTPEQYIKEYLIKIKEVKTNEKLDLVLYAE